MNDAGKSDEEIVAYSRQTYPKHVRDVGEQDDT